jgi:cold shock CspA family protein
MPSNGSSPERPGRFGSGTGPRLGKVTHFDEDRGLGTIVADDGSELGFHCTSIAGGGRRIPEGARVTFATTAGHLGMLEAIAVTLVTLSAQSSGLTLAE